METGINDSGHPIGRKRTRNGIALFVFFLILAVGIFLRAYNFVPWLHFEIDQSYDAQIVSKAVENGIGNLTLLGPTAGGGRALRLGPAFYYMQYLSAEIFGNTPPGHAAQVLILSILALPLLYLFARERFSAEISLGLMAIAACSLYLVLYGRFSWSPNVLPFLMLLSFYALLRSALPNGKRRDLWFLLFAFAGAVTTQIHFNAFFVLPPIAIAFLILTRTNFRWKTWAMALLLILLAYSPVIVSEIRMHGQDTAFFIEKISERGGGKSSLAAKAWWDAFYNAGEYFLIVSGKDNLNVEKASNAPVTDIRLTVASMVLLASEIIILLLSLWKEKSKSRRNFSLLLLLWFLFSFAYFFFIIEHAIFPRFFLAMSPLAVLLIGFLLEKLRPEKNAWRLAALVLIIAAIAGFNLSKVGNYFRQLGTVQTEAIPVQTKDVFPNTARLTYRQEKGIVDYLAERYRENGYPIYFKAAHEYGTALWYLLEERGIDFPGSLKDAGNYAQGNYFIIDSAVGKSVLRDPGLSVSETKDFGLLKVFELVPGPEAVRVTGDAQAARDVIAQSNQLNALFSWNELFAKSQGGAEDYAPDEDDE